MNYIGAYPTSSTFGRSIATPTQETGGETEPKKLALLVKDKALCDQLDELRRVRFTDQK